MVGIYKIISPSGKIYIGQSNNLIKRQKDYIKTIHCKGQIRLYNSIIKYGWEFHVFEIIEYCDISELNEKERKWQDYYDVTSINGLNCKLTPTKDKKLILCYESRKKISDFMKLNNPMFKEENRKKMSNILSGQNNPMFGRKGEKNPASKKIIDTETNKIFNSIKEVSEYTGIKYSTLKSMINGTNRNKTNYKYYDTN